MTLRIMSTDEEKTTTYEVKEHSTYSSHNRPFYQCLSAQQVLSFIKDSIVLTRNSTEYYDMIGFVLYINPSRKQVGSISFKFAGKVLIYYDYAPFSRDADLHNALIKEFELKDVLVGGDVCLASDMEMERFTEWLILPPLGHNTKSASKTETEWMGLTETETETGTT